MYLYKLKLNNKKTTKNIFLHVECALAPMERELMEGSGMCFIPLYISNLVWCLCFDNIISPIQGGISVQVEIAVKRNYLT